LASRDWRQTWGLRVFADPRFVRVALSLVLTLAFLYRIDQVRTFLSGPHWGYDFSAYWLAGRHLIAGQPLYTAAQLAGPYAPQGQFLYLYPPFLAAVVSPLAWLFPEDYGGAMVVWAAIGAAICAAVVLGVGRLEGLTTDPVRTALLLGGTFVFPPLVAELVLGNVHVLLLGLLAVAWWGSRRGRTGEIFAGVAVGTGALIKLFPGVVFVWFVLTGRWRASLWGVAAMLALTVLSLPVTGLEPWLHYPQAIANLAAPENLTDALAPAVWIAGWVPFAVARVFVLAVGLIVVAWAALRLDERASYAIAVAVSVLVAPALFHHYLAIMILPLLLGLRVVLDRPPASRLALAASYLAMWPGQQPLLGMWAWVLNRAIPTVGALGVPATLARWGARGRPSG
jgi:hypothetical protein